MPKLTHVNLTRRENQIKWMQMVADYLDEYLLDEPA